MSPSLIDHFPATLQAQAAQVLQYSPYLRYQLERHPNWIENLVQSHAYAEYELIGNVAQEIAAIRDESHLLKTIRDIRHRESVRLVWRDLVKLAPLEETLRTTSDLADALVQTTLDWWHKNLVEKNGVPRSREGVEQHMLVLGMGKLGGRELNFSSDIDLIFCFPDSGETDGRRALDNQTFFTRVGQKLINSLAQITADGFAYRVDMRLRPFGEAGALALSFDAMEQYYQIHGREWERYALIKARVMAGSEQDGKELMQRLHPFIYRRYLDYGAIEQLREMKIMINREAIRKGKNQDIKLGSGGIREVEFTAQVFQLMRGGRTSELQERNLLKTLDALEALKLLNQDEVQALRTGYHFLRMTENRLQMWQDEQVQALPSDAHQQQQLALSMGFDNYQSFLKALDQHREQVSSIFQKVFFVEEDAQQEQLALTHLWQGQMEDEQAIALLHAWNFDPARASWEQIKALHNGRLYGSLTELARTRLDRLMPDLLSVCSQQSNPVLALDRSLKIIHEIARRSGYVAMLADHPGALEQFVKLISSSVWIMLQLIKHPILLDSLLDTRHLYRPLNRQELDTALAQELQRVDPNDTERVMECLRQFKQSQVLRVAAADITGKLPLMIVSDQLTWIAEAILDQTAKHIWHTTTQKSGNPRYEAYGQNYQADYAVIGYGKLGGIELGYGSDLDIVFLHDSSGQNQLTDGQKPLENAVFFARWAQKIIHTLSTYTHDGRLYETDTRLRPSGSSGLLVSNVEAFRQYQLEKAWIWEHQALLRARAILGSERLVKRFNEVRQEILCLPRDKDNLRHEVLAMREKMWEALSNKDPAHFNIKKDPGGITDIEFIVQYLILANAHEHPTLAYWSDNIRQIDSLRDSGILPTEQASKLANIYRAMRNRTHELALQEQSALVEASEFHEERLYVREVWAQWLSH